MPLFNAASPRSCELRVAYDLADLLAGLEVFQELAEATDSAEAREKIVVGVMPAPENGESFTPDELADKFLLVQIYRVNGSHVVRSFGPGNGPYQRGQLHVTIRRFARESEEVADLASFFWDCMSQLAVDLQEAADEAATPRVTDISAPDGPWRSAYRTKVAQGEYVFAEMIATWGDVDEIGGD